MRLPDRMEKLSSHLLAELAVSADAEIRSQADEEIARRGGKSPPPSISLVRAFAELHMRIEADGSAAEVLFEEERDRHLTNGAMPLVPFDPRISEIWITCGGPHAVSEEE